MESNYSKIESTTNETNFSELVKDSYEKIEYEDIKNEESIFEVFKSKDYTEIVSTILQSIDNHYQDVDSYDDYPYFRVQNTCKYIPKLQIKSEILSERQLRELHAHLPYYNQYKNLKLIYSTSKHGYNLKTFYSKGEDVKNSILIIKDDNQNVFGAYSSEEFRNNPQGFYGTGETFLFSYFKTERIHIFPTTGINDYYIYSDDKILCFGCSDNYFSLSLEKDFLCGYSKSTTTFKNPPLSSKDDFFVVKLELWTFWDSMSFLRISLIKIPYWTLALVMIYYSLAYNFHLSKYDKISKRTLPSTKRKIITCIIFIFSGITGIIKVWVLLSPHIKEHNQNTMMKNEFIKKEVLGQEDNQIFILETIFELFIFSLSLFMSLWTDKDKEEEIITDIYREYRNDKIVKTFSTTIQYLLISCVIIFNVSILNLPVYLFFCLMILFTTFNSKSYFYLTNKFFALFAFMALSFHYIKNIAQFKSKQFDNILGVTNFNSTYSITFFGFFVASYLNSCNILKYSENNFPKQDFNQNKIDENNQAWVIYQTCKNFISKISSVCYNMLLLFLVIFHVCILMFINFLFLFFGISRSNNKWKCFMIPTFILSLFFVTLQYIFNMSGVFTFSNVQVYKWLEIVGIYKYYKAKVNADYSNLKTLDESHEEKIKGMFIDILLIILLLTFVSASNKEKKEKKSSEELENLQLDETLSKKEKRDNQWVCLIVEKSYILCLIFLFACSIVKFDLLHIIYFAFFILLICVSDSYFKTIWDFTLLINSIIIIIVLYFWNILALNFLDLERETDPTYENAFTYLGLKIKKNSIFFVEYWEHILLFLFGFIHNYIVISVFKEDKSFKNLFKFPEWSKTIFIFLSIVLMIVLSIINPLSFQGLFVLTYALVFLLANMFIIAKNKDAFITSMINMLLIISVILIVMKYCINFSFLINFLKDKLNLDDLVKNSLNGYRVEGESTSYAESENETNIKNFSLQDLGLDSMNLNFKLVVNALLIISAKILKSFEKYKQEKEDAPLYESIPAEVNNPNTKKMYSDKISIYCKVFCYQVIYLHSSKIMFLVTVFVCVCLESMIGVLIFGIVLISLFLELKTGWRYSFFPLIIISIFVMGFMYLSNLNAFNKWMTKDYEWFGLYDSNSSHILLIDLFPFIIIILAAFLNRISSKFKHYYVDNFDDKFFKKEADSQGEADRSEKMNYNSNESNNNSFMKVVNMTAVTAISTEQFEEEAIITLSKFWYNVDYFFYLYGFYMVLIIIMLVAFIKVNILSLIFMSFVGFQSFGIYTRTEYLTQKEDNNAPNLKKIKRSWMIFAYFTALFTFFQYINYMWFPPSWKISKPWKNMSFFCSKEGQLIYSSNNLYKSNSDYEYCVSDWKAWLNIDNYNPKDIFYNFLCLFCILLYQKYFTTDEIFDRKRYDEASTVDFTIIDNRKDFSSVIRYFLFIYLKSFILFYIIIISIIYSYRYTNLIYGGFMFISFYLLFKNAALTKQKNNLWKYVQYYNYLILVGFMLFQTPFLPCPVNRDGRSYIGLEECVEEESRLYQSDQLYEYPKNKVDALYMVMVQTIGVLKLDFKLLIVGNLSLFLIYIVALVQQIIFEHPFQSIVDNYHHREKQINCKSRAFKIVQDSHLNVHTEYRHLFTFMEILKGKLARLGKKIIEYGDLWKPYNWDNSRNEENDKLNQKKEQDVEDKFKDEIEAVVDELFFNDKHLAGQLDYKVIKERVNVIRARKFSAFIDNIKEFPIQTQEEMVEREEKLKDEILAELIDDLNILFAEQHIKDKFDLYMNKDHGLEIAHEHFKKLVDDEIKNPLIMSSVNKDYELLKKLFSHSEKKDDVNIVEAVKTMDLNKDKVDLLTEEPKVELVEEQKNEEYKVEDQRIPESNNNRDNNLSNLNNNENFDVNDINPQYHNYIRRLKQKYFKKNKTDDSNYFSYYKYFKKELWRSIDKLLLIDLTNSTKSKPNNLFELLFLSFYTNIEVFIVIAFIIHQCVDASVMSVVYPISYFGYGLVEYPFSNKFYWKTMTVYSLITIIIKLIYQFPFFCGYPFLSVFNIFNENYCEYYQLSEQEITEGFEFILGLRKYNGEYSYPKNSGLFSGILWDIIILCLLLVMRSLLKSKGIWNFVNINNEFTKVPAFESHKIHINSNQISNDNEVSSSRKTWKETINLFFQRLVPELFIRDSNSKIMYKPGVDYYPMSFAALLVILMYTLFFFGNLTGKSSQGIQDALDKQQFSKDLVYTVIILIVIIVIDRIIYKLRSINSEFIYSKFKTRENSEENNILSSNAATSDELDHIETSNLALMTKLVMHYILLIFSHILIFFIIPLGTRISFFNNNSLIFLYLLCCVYFYFSSKQIKFGFPLATKGQYFTESTQLYNRTAFKIYRNVPFLYELRAILDWSITKTSLDLFQWFKMEDSYANLYEVKCDMDIRKARKNGENRWWFEKISWGFCSFIFLMFILILPMILFSSFNPNLVENKVTAASFKINLELKSHEFPYITTYNLNLFDVSTLKINNLKEKEHYNYFKNYLVSQIDDVEERKIQKVKVVNYSQLDWILSPPAINALLKHLEKKTDCYITIEWMFKREFPINNKEITGNKLIKLNRDQIATLRNIVFALKNHQKPEKYSLEVKDAFPKVIRLSNRQWKYLKFDPKHKTPHKENTDLIFQLVKENERDIYWKIRQININNIENSPFYNKNDELSFLLMNDDVISSFFGFNSDGSMPLSIIGIYATLVYTVGKFVRIFFDKISQRVIYEEMPDPNDLTELCEGVYIYRNQRKLKEENYLYDLLIRIYRSPETLIKITGTKVKYLPDEKPEMIN